MLRALFVCSRNRLRSPTAEAIFAGRLGLEVASAGTAPDAKCVLSGDLVEWADVIYVMERRHKALLLRRFPIATEKRLVVLGIADRYRYMQQELVALLEAKCLVNLGLGQD